jgi:proteasome lid subunit RPN8/RPN11
VSVDSPAGFPWREVAAHCERSAPEEAVGVVIEEDGALWVHPLENAVARLAEDEPGRWPGGPSEAFAVDPKEWMTLEQDLDASGGRIAWLYHSHVGHPAVLSEADRAFATVGQAPLIAGLRLLVVAVRDGRAAEATAWSFREGTWTLDGPFRPERESDLHPLSHLD